ncbi:hypothetical protein J007_06623 [Cryptococcus neoformans]|nr:hypothetical protein J007_06623 [Cryptococcus neoformans var. grubii]OXC57842.1 hypothetical protein C358_06716 [Cryptococcus neoformans var. grubii MW-RSA852]
MQGIVHYSDDSSPEARAGPSRLRQEGLTASPVVKHGPSRRNRTSSGVVFNEVSSAPSADRRPIKRQRQSPPALPLASARVQPSNHLSPQNLTHTAQSELPESERGAAKGVNNSILDRAREQGMSDDEILRMVITPAEVEGDEDWGIPPEVDPTECDPRLKAKVERFLKLKYTQGEHINTRLLSSSAFANPHIYTKLVEFVSIDERATAFPSTGWITRRELESTIPTYGPAALSAEQKRKEEAVKATQVPGARKEIGFAKARYSDDGRKRDHHHDREGRKGGRHRDWERERYREKGERHKERRKDRR